jgi:hypothetical protein
MQILDPAKERALWPPKPETTLYRETLAELMRSSGAEGTTVPRRAVQIIAALRRRFALSTQPGDAELFALANELEFWITF